MPLNTATLRAEILRRTDPGRTDFYGWPESVADVAASWAAVGRAYFANMLTPLPSPGALAAGEEAMRAAIVAAAGPEGRLPYSFSQFVSWFSGAWTAFVTAMAPLCVPAVIPGVPATGLVPPVPFSMSRADYPNTIDPAPPAEKMAGTIHAWALTGTYLDPATVTMMNWT